MIGREADGIFIRYGHPDAGRCRIIRQLALEAEDDGLLGIGEDGIVVAAFDATALGDIHVILVVEGYVRDRMIVGRSRNLDLTARIGAKGAIERDRDGPDFRADRVIEAPCPEAQAPDAPFGLGEAPCRGILAVESGRRDIRGSTIIADGRKAAGRPAGETMIECIDKLSRRIETVDQSAIEIGDEELPRGPVEHDVAKARAAIAGDCREERHVSGLAVYPIDRAGFSAPS